MKKIALFTLVAFCCLAIGYAQPGKLDPSFGTNGIVKTSLGVNYNYGGVAKKVLPQSDGSLYVITSGWESSGAPRDPNRTEISVIIKKNPDCSSDLSYGDNGFSRFVSMSANSAETQEDGKIVMVGSIGDYLALARFNTDGSVDSSFSNDGIQTTRFEDYTIAKAVAVDNGKIVVAGLSAFFNGENYISRSAVARFNTNGTLDNTFSEDGRLIEENEEYYPDAYEAQANAVAIQTDGKIIVVGESESEMSNAVRYNTDGSRDSSFSLLNFGALNAVVIQSDGKIVVGGNGGLSRHNADGSLDNTFSGDGSQSIGGIAHSIALQSDGKIVVAGYTNTGRTSDSTNFLSARLNTGGRLDNTFSGDGKLTTNFGRSSNIAYSVAIQNDGKIVAAGYTRVAVGYTGRDSKGDFAIVRYESNGNPDNSFDKDGKLTGGYLQKIPFIQARPHKRMEK